MVVGKYRSDQRPGDGCGNPKDEQDMGEPHRGVVSIALCTVLAFNLTGYPIEAVHDDFAALTTVTGIGAS